MLAHASSLTSSRLLAAPAARLLVGRVLAGECLRLQSTWAMASASPRRKVNASLRQRRPIVNGEAVAFHINDLAPPAPLYHQQQQQRPDQSLYESDLVVVLDMDECLIHSQFLSAHSSSFAHQLLQKRSHNQHGQRRVDNFQFCLPEGDTVVVNVRPGLRDFLARVTEKYETHIFTAAVSIYADPLLDHLDPQGRLAGRWYREHCQYDAGQQAHVKRLERLPCYTPSRTVLVDNNPLSFLANPENGILVSSFYNDPADTSLSAVWNLLEELDGHDDVRPVLEQRFGLRSALSEIQSASSKAA